MVGGSWEKSQTLLSSGLCIETAGLAGETRHVFTARVESEGASDETCLHHADV